MKKLLVFLVFTIAFKAHSQYIEGVVLDAKTHKPIENASVYLDEIDRGATTNSKGKFYIKFPYKVVKDGVITFSHLMYKEQKVKYVSKKKNYKVYLVEDITKLQEVQITKSLKKSIDFKQLTSMKKGRYFFGAQQVNDKIYVVGGNSSFSINGLKKTMERYPDIDNIGEFLKKAQTNYNRMSFRDDILVYDINADKWTEKKEVKFRKRGFHSLNYFNNKLYVVGGKRLSRNKNKEYLDDKIEVYNIKNDSIMVDDTNPHQAVNFASFSVDNKLVLIGGSIKENSQGIKKYISKIHSFDYQTGLWYEIGNMPFPKETNGVVVGDKIYLIGGYNKKPLRTIETFDLKTGKWNQVGELTTSFNSQGIAANNKIIYLIMEV